MELLYFFESIRNPILDAVMQFITFFGGELVFMIIALVILWCVDKPRGYLVLGVGLVGTVINQTLKVIFRVPRPWVLDPEFTIVEGARADATGYSFPSGHTQNAVGTFGSIAATTARRWIKIVCLCLMMLVPLSRMYLGVHTPLDVGVSFGIALVLIALGVPLMKLLKKHPEKLIYVFLGMLALTVAYTLFVEFYHFPADIDAANYASARKNAYYMLGAVAGMCISLPIERKYVRFQTSGAWWVQIIKLVGGFALLIGIKSGLKWLLSLIFGADFMPSNSIRYAAMIIFATIVWPLVFKPLNRLSYKVNNV
ncbi:MAG: phosphatase PAP2 family protein [Eubacteriales bacterium]|nr:phosphatase PAP2 family protein [Eubacteriales bacterium]